MCKITLSQGIEILNPKDPIPSLPIYCSEWRFIKNKISQISVNCSYFSGVGFTFIGAGLGIIPNIFSSENSLFQNIELHQVMFVSMCFLFLCGGLCLYFSSQEKVKQTQSALEVLSHMELIESRNGIEL